MRYPLRKLIFLLVFGPPAAAGWWYFWQDVQSGQFQVDGFIILNLALVVLPTIIVLPLISVTIYFIVCACHSSYQKRLATVPALPILLTAFGPLLLTAAWIAFAAVYPGNLPGGFFTWYVTLMLFVLLSWIVRVLLFAVAVGTICYFVIRLVRWFGARFNSVPTNSRSRT